MNDGPVRALASSVGMCSAVSSAVYSERPSTQPIT